mgnify:CR=1 FL=1
MIIIRLFEILQHPNTRLKTKPNIAAEYNLFRNSNLIQSYVSCSVWTQFMRFQLPLGFANVWLRLFDYTNISPTLYK